MTNKQAIIGVDVGTTGKIAVFDVSKKQNVEERIRVYSCKPGGKFVDIHEMNNLANELINIVLRGYDIHCYVEKFATGQNLRGVQTAAANFGITYTIFSLLTDTTMVPAQTWQARLKLMADVNGWSNKKSKRATKDLPSLIAYSFAPELAKESYGKKIDIDDNIADSVCISIYGAIVNGFISELMIKG